MGFAHTSGTLDTLRSYGLAGAPGSLSSRRPLLFGKTPRRVGPRPPAREACNLLHVPRSSWGPEPRLPITRVDENGERLAFPAAGRAGRSLPERSPEKEWGIPRGASSKERLRGAGIPGVCLADIAADWGACAQVAKGKSRPAATSYPRRRIGQASCKDIADLLKEADPTGDQAWETLAGHDSCLNELRLALMQSGRRPDAHRKAK